MITDWNEKVKILSQGSPKHLCQTEQNLFYDTTHQNQNTTAKMNSRLFPWYCLSKQEDIIVCLKNTQKQLKKIKWEYKKYKKPRQLLPLE